MKHLESIKIPVKMEHLQKDKRGYPVPFSIYRNKSGEPDFRMHDPDRLRKCMEEAKCSICGTSLNDDIWLLAGAKTALTPQGAYLDPPMHKECGTYALQVCPYLAMPSFRKISPNEIENSNAVRMFDGKPTVFAFVKTSGYLLIAYRETKVIIPHRPFHHTEYWREGRQLTWNEAKALL